MKFEEKLIEQRKKAGLSQEQLADMLDVTRQTVSKWELGLSKPDMDKLIKMSEIFKINVDDLIGNGSDTIKKNNDIEKEISYEKVITEGNDGGNKVILYIVIILLIASVGTLGYRIINDVKNNEENQINRFFNMFNRASEQAEESQEIFDDTYNSILEEIGNQKSKSEINKFNSSYNSGKQWGTIIESDLAELIDNNKQNSEHQINFTFNGVNYFTDETEIARIKNSLDDFTDYDVSFNYDEDGYIIEFILNTIE